MTRDADSDPQLPAHARTREATDSGRNATGLARVWARLEQAEEYMATMGAGLSVTQKLMAECGVTRRQARALQAAVRMRWQQEAVSEPREQRLARYRRTLEQVVKQGFDRKVTVCTNRDADEYEVVPQPDLKAVTAATALLIRMDGGDQPAGDGPALPANAGGETVVLSETEAEAALIAARKAGQL